MRIRLQIVPGARTCSETLRTLARLADARADAAAARWWWKRCWRSGALAATSCAHAPPWPARAVLDAAGGAPGRPVAWAQRDYRGCDCVALRPAKCAWRPRTTPHRAGTCGPLWGDVLLDPLSVLTACAHLHGPGACRRGIRAARRARAAPRQVWRAAAGLRAAGIERRKPSEARHSAMAIRRGVTQCGGEVRLARAAPWRRAPAPAQHRNASGMGRCRCRGSGVTRVVGDEPVLRFRSTAT